MRCFPDTAWYHLECALLDVTERITDAGFPMDRPAAERLLAELHDAENAMAEALQLALPPTERVAIFVPKRNNKTKCYLAGVPYHKKRMEAFNPGSPVQFYDRMLLKYGVWPSKVTTKTGAASVSSAVLATLPWPEAEHLLRLKVASKRITMLAGDAGYITKLSADDRLHTSYSNLGTITGRASHRPNIAQVPGVILDTDKQPLLGVDGHWGHEFRSLFHAPDDMVLVGIDLVGLEARVMAHYLARWDGGEYARLVTADADLHELNRQTTGVSSRAQAKRLFYALCFGCGNRKAGSIAAPDEDDEAQLNGLGKVVNQALIGGIVGFAELIAWLEAMPDDTIPGLDGRPIHARKRHARVNTIIQSAGAIIAKRWLVLTDAALCTAAGLRWGIDYALVCWCHDEQVFACRPALAEQVAAIAKQCAIEAGEFYTLDCPMAASAKIGRTWAEVH